MQPAREGVEVTVSRYLSVSGEGCSVVQHPKWLSCSATTVSVEIVSAGGARVEKSGIQRGARDEQQAGPGKRPFVEVGEKEQKVGPDRRLGREARGGSTSCRRRQVVETLTLNDSFSPSILLTPSSILKNLSQFSFQPTCNSLPNQRAILFPTHQLHGGPRFLNPEVGEEPCRNLTS